MRVASSDDFFFCKKFYAEHEVRMCSTVNGDLTHDMSALSCHVHKS